MTEKKRQSYMQIDILLCFAFLLFVFVFFFWKCRFFFKASIQQDRDKAFDLYFSRLLST